MAVESLPASFLEELIVDLDPGLDVAALDSMWDLKGQLESGHAGQVRPSENISRIKVPATHVRITFAYMQYQLAHRRRGAHHVPNSVTRRRDTFTDFTDCR